MSQTDLSQEMEHIRKTTQGTEYVDAMAHLLRKYRGTFILGGRCSAKAAILKRIEELDKEEAHGKE